MKTILSILFSVMVGACTGARPSEMETFAGMLPKCPDTPNCVCSEYRDDTKHYIDPINYAGDTYQAKIKLKGILSEMPRTEVVKESDNYMHVEFTSLVFRFVDDVQFYFPKDEKVIHVRSASRIGRSDFNVNRKRVEAIRAGMQK